METLNLVLDKRRVKKNGAYPVVFRLTANRKHVAGAGVGKSSISVSILASHNALIETIVSSDVHIVATMRTKTEYVIKGFLKSLFMSFK